LNTFKDLQNKAINYDAIKNDKENLRTTHFTLGSYNPKAFYNSSYLSDYQPLPGTFTKLSEEQRNDLRKHHFLLGSL